MIFTIAIPVYNGGKSLRKTIESAINQNFSLDYEILISNNGSSDDSGSIIESYVLVSEKITVVERKDTVPMYENHNICLREASGNYVLFCHADDFLLNDCLDRFYEILKKRNFPDKYVLWGRSMFRDFYTNWQVAGIGLNNILAGQKAILPFMNGGLAPSGVCYSRNTLLALNGFCKANLRLTPFDITTMLKMAIEGFEFEMVDRLFFIRRFATTASTLTPVLVRESVADALQCLNDELGVEKFGFLTSLILESNVYAPFLFSYLVKENLISKSYTQKFVVKYILKNPSNVIKGKFYKEIKSIV